MRIALAVLASAAAPSTTVAAAPGTTERRVTIEQQRFAFDGAERVVLSLDFDRRPTRLEQVVVGMHVINPVRAQGGVDGRRFTGSLRVSTRPAGEPTWRAGRTYPLLVIFCPQRRAERQSGAPVARAAKGGCTWIRSRVHLRPR